MSSIEYETRESSHVRITNHLTTNVAQRWGSAHCAVIVRQPDRHCLLSLREVRLVAHDIVNASVISTFAPRQRLLSNILTAYDSNTITS